MPKHTYDEFFWNPPVELVSAFTNVNVESIWDQACKFKETIGIEKIKKRR